MNNIENINIATIDNKSDACISLTYLYNESSYINSLKICGTKSGLMNLIVDNKINFVVIDLDVGKIDGIKLLEEVRQVNSEIKILIVANEVDSKYITTIQNKANGLFIKGDTTNTLLGVILIISSGYCLYLNSEEKNKPTKNKLVLENVSKRELEIIELVSLGYSNKQIANTLYLTDGSVRNYISTILYKLNLSNRTKLAIWYQNNTKN